MNRSSVGNLLGLPVDIDSILINGASVCSRVRPKSVRRCRDWLLCLPPAVQRSDYSSNGAGRRWYLSAIKVTLLVIMCVHEGVSPPRLPVCREAACQPSRAERPFKRLLVMGWCELPCKTHRCARLHDPSDRHLLPHWAQRLCERCFDGVRRPAAHERAHSAQVCFFPHISNSKGFYSNTSLYFL